MKTKYKPKPDEPMVLRDHADTTYSPFRDAEDEQMVRTQIYLTRREHQFLQDESARRSEPMSVIIREIIDERMTIPEDAWANNPMLEPTPVVKQWKGRRDGSINHDHYVYGGPKKYHEVNGEWGPGESERNMKRVFVDSAFWVGMRDTEDPRHLQARKIAHWLVENRYMLVVTPFIFAETQAYFCREEEIRQQVIRDFWENRAVHFEQASYLDQQEAVSVLKQHRDKSYSFADAVSFVIMKRLGLADVVTFDRHFRQFGKFNVIDEVPT